MKTRAYSVVSKWRGERQVWTVQCEHKDQDFRVETIADCPSEGWAEVIALKMNEMETETWRIVNERLASHR